MYYTGRNTLLPISLSDTLLCNKKVTATVLDSTAWRTQGRSVTVGDAWVAGVPVPAAWRLAVGTSRRRDHVPSMHIHLPFVFISLRIQITLHCGIQ